MNDVVPVPSDPLLAAIRARTPARILEGRAGLSYRTATQLALRADHAAAVDAVHASLDLERDLGHDLVRTWNLFLVETQARDKREFLLHPEKGRCFSQQAETTLEQRCPRGVDLQVVIGDGLSVAAVSAQVPGLLPLLAEEARQRQWTWGQPFVVTHCRVGLLNAIGTRLDPMVAVLLIGERPGLATSESLSAYLAYRPCPGHTDAQRNLISNIHKRGIPLPQAARRIAALVDSLRRYGQSGIQVKEEWEPETKTIPRDFSDTEASGQPS